MVGFTFTALGRAARGLALALVLGPGMAPVSSGQTTQIVAREVHGAAIEDVRLALEDAIATEGIGSPTLSHFGDMLSRTAADLGHSPSLYGEAVIYTFCSASTAAGLAHESPHNIALCPLSIAVYTVPATPGAVFLGYRRSADTTAGHVADAVMERIVTHTARLFGDVHVPADPATSPVR